MIIHSLTGPRCGDIGDDPREIELEPLTQPATEPITVPATPATPEPAREPVPAGACLEWQGYIEDGYGRKRFGDKMERVHRIAWMEAHGPIPQDRGCRPCNRSSVAAYRARKVRAA